MLFHRPRGPIVWRRDLSTNSACASAPALSGERQADAFYHGKIVVASFFAKNVLPTLSSTRAILASLGSEVMELDEAAF
jgi:hypothetical protein